MYYHMQFILDFGVNCLFKWTLMIYWLWVCLSKQLLPVRNSIVTLSAQPTKSATFCGNLPKTYSMICLAYNEEEKNSKSRNVTKKPSFINWGLKNKLKSASTLSLPTADHSGTHPWNKPCPTFPSSSSYNNDSSLYWASGRLSAVCCVQCCAVPILDLLNSLSTGILGSVCTLYVHMSWWNPCQLPWNLAVPNTVFRCLCWYMGTFPAQFRV